MALKFDGYEAHKKTVDILNVFLMGTTCILFTSIKFINKQNLPAHRPIIFAANHQSMYDIPPLIWFLRKQHAKFISKIELTKGIPSISFNLKYGGGANINRKDSKQSLIEIARLGERMQKNNWSAVIFPEGTRSKNGAMKDFQIGGIAALLKRAPNALIVPVAIQNSWKIIQYGVYPLHPFQNLIFTVLPPIEPANKPLEEVIKETEYAIRAIVEN